jgi:hypothetical protein
MRNTVLSPRHRLRIAAHLDVAGAGSNREALVALAAGANSEPGALAFVEMVRMYASTHERIAPISGFVDFVGLPAAQSSKGLVMCLPADLVHWDKETERIVTALGAMAGNQSATIAVLGDITVRATKAMQRAGMKLQPQFMRW